MTITPRNFTLNKAMALIMNGLDLLSYASDSKNPYDKKTLPIATGASADHFPESLSAVRSFQEVFPEAKLHYYDLGLTQAQIRRVW